MKQVTKDKYKLHTQDRFKERFEIELSDEDYYKISKLCKSGAPSIETLTYKGGKTKQVRKAIVKFNGIRLLCVYHVKTGFIKTLYRASKKQQNKIYSAFNSSALAKNISAID